ncbi:MAG: hypothetical protein ACT4PN_16755 [Nitrospiraceae bacterium]
MLPDLHINGKPGLLVAASLVLTYILAFVTLMIRWMNFWIRGSYFLSYQAIFLISLMISLLWWVRRHHTGPLPVLSTLIYSTVAGYASGLIAMTLYPIFLQDGIELIAMSLRFSTPEAVIAFFWFPIRLLSWLFGGMTGVVTIVMSRRFKLLST